MAKNKQSLIPRDIFEPAAAHLKEAEITLITGARQVGKTILLRMLKDWLIGVKKINSGNILSYNLDTVKDRELFQDQTKFIDHLESLSERNKLFVFVDEAQKVPDCARFFKGVYDCGLPVKLILSGSASFELKAKLKESLAGRKRIFQLSSFSFYEFLLARDATVASRFKTDKRYSDFFRRDLIKFYKEYLIWGGYPRLALTSNPEERVKLLTDIYSSYIEKDVIGFMEVKNWMKFSDLLKLVAGQIGSLVNIAELAGATGLDRETVERYLKTLQETYIIQPLLPYYKNPRQEIIKQHKIYFQDAGIRNYALENYAPISGRPDSGFLLENAALREIQAGLAWNQKVRFWRTKQGAEVDFVVIEKEKELIPIEVKLNVKKPAISLGFRSFIEKYSPTRALVVSLGIFNHRLRLGKTRISFIHPYELADNLF